MNTYAVSLTLRIALAFSFLYPAIAGFLTPQNWIGYFPPFLFEIFPDALLLPVFGVFEITLALWILSGWKPIPANTLASLILTLIVVSNFAQMDVVFRDISLIGLSVGLILIYKEKKERES